MELQLNDDPVWLYFDSHHKQIIDQMNSAYQAAVRSIEGKTQRANISHKVSDTWDSNHPEDDLGPCRVDRIIGSSVTDRYTWAGGKGKRGRRRCAFLSTTAEESRALTPSTSSVAWRTSLVGHP